MNGGIGIGTFLKKYVLFNGFRSKYENTYV